MDLILVLLLRVLMIIWVLLFNDVFLFNLFLVVVGNFFFILGIVILNFLMKKVNM